VIARILDSLRRLLASPTRAAQVPQRDERTDHPETAHIATTNEPETSDAFVEAEAPASPSVDAVEPAATERLQPVEATKPTLAPADRAAAGLILRLESARGEPVTFEVAGSGATLGRASENAIQLDDLSVSRRHARIAYRQRAYWLSDVGSVGGTWVDGAKLSAPRRLAEGQVIDIGMCRLTVIAAVPPPLSPPARARSSHR
jgi:hypothetical protein